MPDNSADAKIKISPAFHEVHSEPGKTVSLSEIIRNGTDKDINMTVSVESLSVEPLKDENYLKFEQGKGSSEVKNWVKLDKKEIFVKKGGEYKFNFDINIPKDTELKGYYPALVYKYETTTQNVNDVDFSTKLVSVVFLDVTKKEYSALAFDQEIEEFSAKDRFTFSPKNQFSLTYKNKSETFIHPRGVLSVYDSNGQKLSTNLTVNDKYEFLLPSQKLFEQLNWKDKNSHFSLIPKFGRYKAEVEVYQGITQSAPVTSTTSFYVIPIYHLIVLGLLALLFIVLIARHHYMKKDKKK